MHDLFQWAWLMNIFGLVNSGITSSGLAKVLETMGQAKIGGLF